MASGDWLPAQAPFDLVRRGYSPEQVTAHLERLEYDLRIATANRDATHQRVNELTHQLSAAHAEVDNLRAQLDRLALEPVSTAGMSDRMQRMIRLAEDEASDIRARAESDAEQMKADLQAGLAGLGEQRAAFAAEQERGRQELADQVRTLTAQATADAEAARSAAQREAQAVTREATQEAEDVVADANRKATQMVSAATSSSQTMVAKATVDAEKRVADATAEAERLLSAAKSSAESLTREASERRTRLDTEAKAKRAREQEDFDIAVAARRSEAAKTIADREQASREEEHRLISEATATAHRYVAEARSESELLMQRATTYSNALVNRAAAEANRRVQDADDAVAALLDLRTRITDQLRSLAGHLDHIYGLASAAPDLLDPPADEDYRLRPSDFPSDPGERPTEVEQAVPVLETGSDYVAPPPVPPSVQVPPPVQVPASGPGTGEAADTWAEDEPEPAADPAQAFTDPTTQAWQQHPATGPEYGYRPEGNGDSQGREVEVESAEPGRGGSHPLQGAQPASGGRWFGRRH